MQKNLENLFKELKLDDESIKELANAKVNVPIKGKLLAADGSELQVRRMTPPPPKHEKKDKHGNVYPNTKLGVALPVYTNDFENNSMRREVKQAPRGSGDNRKATPGRKIQMVDKTVKVKIGNITVNEPTGYVKRIVHHVAQTKVRNSLALNKGFQAYQNRLNEEAAASIPTAGEK